MRRTRVVIQSRLDSSRLPGKAMLTIGGMPLIELVARRASRSGHEVVVATSEERFDDRIAAHLERTGIRVVRGPLDDVLGRFVLATSDLADDDRVVRLTGDNPVADADLVDELLAAMDESGHVYGRVDIDQVPEGLGAEGFTAGSLRQAAATAVAAYDREHVTPWLRRELGELLFVPSANPADRFRYRCTVDVLSDYDRAVRLFEGEPDPVGVPWTALVGRLEAVTEGVRAQRPADGPQSSVVLGLPVPGEGGRLGGAELRALLGAAVDLGITHVETSGADGAGEAAAKAGLDPAFTQRIGVVLRVAAPTAPESVAGLAVECEVERRLAHLGRRKVAAIVLEDVASSHADQAWEVLRAYAKAGVADRLGATAGSTDELDRALRLEGLALLRAPVELLPGLGASADLRGRVASGELAVTAFGLSDEAGGEEMRMALEHPLVTSVSVESTTPGGLRAAVRHAAAASPA